MSKPEKKWRAGCRDCGWLGMSYEILEADNPFDRTMKIQGCPHCSEVTDLYRACDVTGCKYEATCGTRTHDGYMTTCGHHVPSFNE